MKGNSFGAALMLNCFAEARRKACALIWLCVWRYNLPARKFYENFGFEKVGELPFEYGGGFEINFVLSKKLESE